MTYECKCTTSPDVNDSSCLMIQLCDHHLQTLKTMDELFELSRELVGKRDDASNYLYTTTSPIGRTLLPSELDPIIVDQVGA